MAVFPTPERCVNMLVNFILPLCIRVGCGRRDTPKLRQSDISYALTVILNVLKPPVKTSSAQNNSSTKSAMHHLSITEHGRCGSISNNHKNVAVKYQGNELLIQTAYLGLEMLMACFDKPLASEWHRVAKCIIHSSQHVFKACMPFWKFLDFVVTHRPSIFLMLQPFIEFKMRRVNCDTTTEHRLQQSIKEKLQGTEIINPKCTGSVLVELALELKHIKDEFVSTGGEYRSRSATMVTDRSDYSAAQDIRFKNSVTEITAEIIGQPKPSLATIGKRASKGTILSQGSSNASAPFKATVMTSSFDSTSPTSGRRSSRRISALDGTRILEKFKTPTQEEISPTYMWFQTFQESPKPMSRKPTIVCRPPLSAQNSLDEPSVQVLYENEVRPDGGNSDLFPREHRLQRQDAKSRKTFKVKRTKTNKPTSMRRLVSNRGLGDSETESNSTESSPTRYGRHSKKHYPEKEVLQLHRTGTGTHWPRAGSPSNVARSVETISENMEDKKKPSSRPRYIQRSKSHDDPHADIHAPAGTVRGRIARQGARIVRSRSPSSSPVRAHKSPTHSPPPATSSIEPAEVPVNVTYAGIPGAGSPPASAQSLKESNNIFRYSLKKRVFRPKEKPVIDSSASDNSPTTPISRSITNPLSSSVQPDPFCPPGYDKPKPVVKSPDKEISGISSLVKSRISQFTMNDTHKQAAPAEPAKIPPPIPPRTRPAPTKPPIPVKPSLPAKPPTTLDLDGSNADAVSSMRFKSRDRQRPISPPRIQTVVSRYQQHEPANQHPESRETTSAATSPEFTQKTNPFVTSPESPDKQLLLGKGRKEGMGDIRQAYVSSRCSSDESLTEFSTLLKDDEKSKSRSSVCIYFDGKEIPDTLV